MEARSQLRGTRVTLYGEPSVTTPTDTTQPERLPGSQPKVVLAALALRQPHPVDRFELENLLWDGDSPPTWRTATRGLLTVVRKFLQDAVGDLDVIPRGTVGYRLLLPPPVHVDVTAVAEKLRHAERALAAGRHADAAQNARSLLRATERPFLTGASGRWVELGRENQRSLRFRAMLVDTEVKLAGNDRQAAINAARGAVDLDPSSDAAHRLLLRSLGRDRQLAAAIDAHERHLNLLRTQYGIRPPKATLDLYGTMLRQLG